MGKLVHLARKGQAPGGGLYVPAGKTDQGKKHMAEEMPKPKKPIYKRWWVWVLGFVVLIIIISSAGDPPEKESTTTASQSQTQQVVAEPPAIKAIATQILADYEANEVAADQKYKGKIVEVSGTIKNIGKDILDTPYVSFESGNIVFGVQCMFDKSDTEKLAALKQDQKITLTGKVSGKLGNVIIRECKF